MSKRTPAGSRRDAGSTRKSLQYQSAKKLYDARKRAVAPLVDFTLPDYDATTQWARRKLKKYSEYLLGSADQPGIASGVRAKVRRKDPEQLAKLQREMNQGALPGIKYAFVPTTIDPQTRRPIPVKVTSRKTSPDVIKVGAVSNVSMPFDADALIESPNSEIERVMRELEEEMPDADVIRFQIQNGEQTIKKMHTRRELPLAIQDLMNRYGDNAYVVKKSPSRHWDRWLFGITAHGAQDQREVHELERAMVATANRKKKVRKFRQDWGGVLDTLEQLGGHAPSESVARGYSGDTTDQGTRDLLAQLKRTTSQLVTGDDNRWTITAAGRAYVRELRGLNAYLSPQPKQTKSPRSPRTTGRKK